MFDFLDWLQFSAFITSVTLLNLLPGMNVLFICGESIQKGKRHGILAALGVSTGIIIYLAATIFGISEICKHAPFLFHIIRYMGIGYLIFLSYQAFTSSPPRLDLKSVDASRYLQSYGKGIITTLLNPKELLFFCTFLPQFTKADSPVSMAMQLLWLGSWDVFSATIVSIGYVFVVIKVRERAIQNTFIQTKLQYVTGVIFGVLALGLLWADLT